MDKNKCKLISLGKCYKKYWLYILGIIITDMAFDILITFLLAYQEKEGKYIMNSMSYLFFLNLGESLMFILDLILKKKTTSKIDNSSKKNEELNRIERYIFNKISVEFSKKDKIYIILFGILNLIFVCLYSFY